jgi:ubiquinone/menaquinone biosynthesis C-methylase UbiE
MNANQRNAWERKYATQGILWARTHDEWFRVNETDRVLDLGSGSGKSARSLKGEITALDFSFIALKKAVGSPTGPTNRVCGEATVLPFKDSAFDFVRASFILDHLSGPERKIAVNEIHRVIRRSGRVAFESFSISDARCAMGSMDSKGDLIDGDGILHHYFVKDEVASLLTEFEIDFLKEISWEQRIGSGEKMERSIIRAIAMKK